MLGDALKGITGNLENPPQGNSDIPGWHSQRPNRSGNCPPRGSQGSSQRSGLGTAALLPWVSVSPHIPGLSLQEVGRIQLRMRKSQQQPLAFGEKHFSRHLPLLPLPLLLVSAPCFPLANPPLPQCMQPCPTYQGAPLTPGQGWAHDQPDPLSWEASS